MNRTVMSQASAVHLIAVWIQAHGHPPSRRDCREANGLPHAQTLQYVCSGLTQAVSLAHAYLALGSAALSSDEQGIGSACPCSVRMTTCLRCGRQIVWQGPHVRQCERCRKTPLEAEETVLHVRWVGMRGRWPWEEAEDLVDWREE